MTPKETYLDLGIQIYPADYPDLTGMVDTHARVFVEAYNNEALVNPKLETDDDYLSRETIEHFVYRSSFLERITARHRGRIDDQSDKHQTLVAKHEGRVIGFSNTSVKEASGAINALYVLPEYHKRLLGKALIQGLLDNTDIQDISLLATKDTRAVGFYQHHGFVVTHELPREECPEIAPGKWLYQLGMIRKSSKS